VPTRSGHILRVPGQILTWYCRHIRIVDIRSTEIIELSDIRKVVAVSACNDVTD